jgi:hypothetical protein
MRLWLLGGWVPPSIRGRWALGIILTLALSLWERESLVRTRQRQQFWQFSPLLLGLALLAACVRPSATPTPTDPPAPIPTTVAPSPTEVPTVLPPTLVAATPTDLPTEVVVPTVAATATPLPPGVPSPTATPFGVVAPIGVMIDNDPHARPQTGLNSADVVYEIVAEFDLTRFLAVYFVNAPTKVGSIRSTRPYFAQMMAEYGGGLVHCLDVPGTIAALDSGNVYNFDLCRGHGEEGAIRVIARAMPFNLFVNAALLQAELRQRPPRRAAALVAGRAPLGSGGRDASGVDIVYAEGHRVSWGWSGQTYERAQDGASHLTADGSVVTTDVVVVQRAATRPTRYFGDGGYHVVDLIGGGNGLILANGKSVPVRWSRASLDAPTIYLDANGQSIPLPPGRIFIQVVPTNSRVDLRT